MRYLVLMIAMMLACSGCTVVNARIDVTAAGLSISAAVAGISTDVTIPLPDILPDREPEVPEQKK